MSNRKKVILLLLFTAIVLLIAGCLNDGRDNRGDVQSGSITWGGLKRTYILHIPASHNNTRSVPLMIVLHGGGGNAEKMVELTSGGFNDLSDRAGFVVVYPEGVERNWNDGRKNLNYRAHRENIDDAGFLSALIDKLVKELNVDPKRVYVTGASNGALMSHRLACERADKIAAIAPVIGAMPSDIAPNCSPAREIPVLMINGVEDPLVPWEAGEISSIWGWAKLGKVSIPETIEFWVRRNNCSPVPSITWEPDRDPEDGTRVRREAYGSCENGSEVVFYAIEGGGHTWPCGYQYFPELLVGRTSRDMDASEVIWEFFKRQEIR